MELRGYYVKKDPSKKKLKISYDKKSKDRPAWIQIKGLPEGANFIVVHLGKEGVRGRRIQFYKTHLPPDLFIPVNHTSEEMRTWYDKLAKTYDKKAKESNYNLYAVKFLYSKTKKYVKKNTSILDLGAGTGLMTEVYVNSGFNDITLVEYSKEMLNKAQKNKKLKNCKFICKDLRELNLNKQYDLVVSHFSLGSLTYFSEDETKKILMLIKKHLKSKGVIALIGHFNRDLFGEYFKELDSGVYTMDKKRGFYCDYFIGRR